MGKWCCVPCGTCTLFRLHYPYTSGNGPVVLYGSVDGARLWHCSMYLPVKCFHFISVAKSSCVVFIRQAGQKISKVSTIHVCLIRLEVLHTGIVHQNYYELWAEIFAFCELNFKESVL